MNNSAIIENLLGSKKSKNLVFQPSLQFQYLGQILCGFLNGQGGDVILGMASKSQITGIEPQWPGIIGKEVITTIRPAAPISCTTINYKNREVLLLSAWPGAKKPYSFNGKIYVYLNGEARTASARELKTLNQVRKESEFHWERQPVLGATIDDLDNQEISNTIEEYVKLNPGNHHLSAGEFLSRMGLIYGGSLTNAAIVLFGRLPVRFVPQSKIRATIYSSTKGGKTILFDRVYDGNIFRNIQMIWDFFDTQLARSSNINSLQRTTKDIPILALREGLLNALIHRDYSKISSTVNISVYPEKLVITNTGKLPEEITVRDLKKDHDSILRNPDMAYILYVRRYIEMIGTGTLRMIEDCKDHDYPIPEWKTKGNSLELSLNSIGHRIKYDGVSDGVSDGVNRLIADGVSDGVIDGISDGVKKEIIEIAKYLYDAEGSNTDDVVDHIGKSKPTIERYLKIARDVMIVEFKGAPKTGGYYLTKRMKKYL